MSGAIGGKRGEGGLRQIDARAVAAARSEVTVQAVRTQTPIEAMLVGSQRQVRSAGPLVQIGVAQPSAQAGMLVGICALTTEAAAMMVANERYFMILNDRLKTREIFGDAKVCVEGVWSVCAMFKRGNVPEPKDLYGVHEPRTIVRAEGGRGLGVMKSKILCEMRKRGKRLFSGPRARASEGGIGGLGAPQFA